MSAPTTPELAEVLGVIVRDPHGDITVENGWARIGTVIDRADRDGTVHVVPRFGVGGNGLERLLAVATSVAVMGRGVSPAWRYHPELGWVVCVVVRVSEADALVSAAAAEVAR